MTDTPERVWRVAAYHPMHNANGLASWPNPEHAGEGATEYVRADVAQAMVAAAYAYSAAVTGDTTLLGQIAVDAETHMDAMLTKAHEEGKAEGLKEAAAIVSQVIQAYAMMKPGKPDQYASREAQIVAKGFARLIEEEILALIPPVKDAR